MNRNLAGMWNLGVRAVTIACTLFHLYTAGFGFLPDMRQRAIHVAFGLVLCFALKSMSKPRNPETKIPIWDLLFIVVAIVSCVNVFLNYMYYYLHPLQTDAINLVLGGCLLLLVLESARRLIGLALPILAVLMVLYALFGHYLPGQFSVPSISLDYIVIMQYQMTDGLWGYITGISATVIALYIIFGVFLEQTGSGKTFTEIALRIAGNFPGGPALTAVVASLFFGTISGSAVANASAVGNFTIPLMKRAGYTAEFAGATEAAASTGGQIMPPVMGAGAFIMAEMLHISYFDVMVAAIIPALLYYWAIFSYILLESRRLKLKPVPEKEMPKWREILTYQKMAPLLIPIFILLFLLFSGYTPATAAFWACVALVIIYLFTITGSGSGFKQRLGKILGAFESGGIALMGIISLVACANLIVGLFGMTGLGLKLGSFLFSIAGNSIFLALILAAVLVSLLGMGIPTTAAYVVAMAVVSYPLSTMGFQGLNINMFVFFYSVLSVITPPVAPVSYVAAALAKANWFRTGMIACRLALIAFIIPFKFVYSPNILLQGDPIWIIVSIISVTIGVVGLAVAFTGYLTSKVNLLTRIIMFAGGLISVLPGSSAEIIGALIVVLTACLHIVLSRRFRQVMNAG